MHFLNFRATILQHETNKSDKINIESVAKPAVIRAGSEGKLFYFYVLSNCLVNNFLADSLVYSFSIIFIRRENICYGYDERSYTNHCGWHNKCGPCTPNGEIKFFIAFTKNPNKVI